MHDAPGSAVRVRLIALDLAALVMRAAAIGLCVALMLAGATLLFSSHAEAAEPVHDAAASLAVRQHGGVA